MKLTGKIVGSTIDYRTNKPTVSFAVNEMNDFKQMVDDMGGLDKLTIEVKPFRLRRSLDANAYAWVLMDRLSERLGVSKIDIYRSYIPHIGGNSEVVCVKDAAVRRLCEGWQKNGIGWQTETFTSKLEGCTNIILYYGSSEYDTSQMHRLLELIIEDCREQGIQTDTPEEIARMEALWGEK